MQAVVKCLRLSSHGTETYITDLKCEIRRGRADEKVNSHKWWTITTGTSTIYFTAEDKAVPEKDSELPSHH